MPNRIKGITIEIDGSVTKLDKALSGVNTSLRNVQNELKDVDRLLKMDPGNTELLRQKQNLLAEAVRDTKDKLETEKAALQQLRDADQSPEVKNQMEALERQIVADEQSLKNLKKESREFGSVAKQEFEAAAKKLEEMGDKVKEAGRKMQEAGGAMTKSVTAPVVAGAVASVAAFKDVDAGMDTIVRKTGAVGEKADEMRGIMENIATSIPTDFTTAGEAIGEVNTRFGLTGEALEELSGQYIKFAELNNTDVSSSIDLTQKALSAYGEGADAASGYLDRLNKVGQNTGVSVDKLSSGIVSNATAFKEMGLSLDEATEFMGLLEKSGANSETVLNGMRKALKNAAKDGIPLNEALADLQDTILNGTDSMDGLTAAYDIFGKSGDQIYGAVKDGTIDFLELAGAIEDANGSVSDTYNATLDPMDQFTTVLNQLKLLGADIIETIGPMLTDVMQKLSEAASWLSEKWNGLSEDQQELVLKLVAVAAAIGPVLTIVGGLVTAIGALMSPIGLVVLAIAAAIAIGVLLYQNWDTIKQKAGELRDMVVEKWNSLKEGVSSAVDTAKQRVHDTWEAMKNNATTTVENIRQNAVNKWEEIKGSVTATVENLKGSVKEKWDALKSSVSETVESIKGSIKEKFDSAKESALGIFEGIGSGIREKMDAAKEFVSNAIENIKGLFNFDLSFPHIKLPHFNWHWVDLGGILSIPMFDGIDWYRKAMDTPRILSGATIFGESGGKLLGGGEAGPEVVGGLDSLLSMIRSAVASVQPVQTVNFGDTNITVNGAEVQDVSELADIVADKINDVYEQERMVFA